MRRLFLVLGIVLVVLACLAGTVAALAYGSDATREGRLEVEGVAASVELAWDASGVVSVSAETLPDLAAGLGYAHAADHALAMTLWRQAGRGSLGEWFGARTRGLDRHARALGLDAVALETYRQLDDETRALLDAYADGANAALREPGVAQGDAFVLLDVEPEPWRPWDALVVERLIAYLGTPGLADTTGAARDSSLIAFVRADSTFRASLGIGGTDGARAFRAPVSGGEAFVTHQPTGRSSLDLFAPATLRLGGRSVAVATIPGTLSLPVGWTGSDGWSVFLTSPLRLEPFRGAPPPFVHSRIVERDGGETLITSPRDSSGLVLAVADALPLDPLAGASSDSLASASPDSFASAVPDSLAGSPGWRLRWSGFRPGTDVPTFARLLRGEGAPGFTLLRGDGLLVQCGAATALGAPPVWVPDLGFAAASPASARAASVLAWIKARGDTAAAPLSAAALADSDASLWAARTLRPLLRALGDRDSLDAVLDAPYAFLKGWDHRYAPDAIAPSLFETWLASHRDYTGHAPDPTDSLDVALLPFTLRIARATLRDTYGPDVIDWQWGRLQPSAALPAVEGNVADAIGRRFARSTSGSGGHPTALFPGPVPRDSTAGAGSVTWSAWATLGDAALTLRHPALRTADPTAGTAPTPLLWTPGGAAQPAGSRLTLVSPS